MSVLVKGMKMPETCMRCDFLRFYNAYCCGLLLKKIDNGKRRKDCPLVEVVRTGEGLYDTYTPLDKETAKHVTEVFRKSTERIEAEE